MPSIHIVTSMQPRHQDRAAVVWWPTGLW